MVRSGCCNSLPKHTREDGWTFIHWHSNLEDKQVGWDCTFDCPENNEWAPWFQALQQAGLWGCTCPYKQPWSQPTSSAAWSGANPWALVPTAMPSSLVCISSDLWVNKFRWKCGLASPQTPAGTSSSSQSFSCSNRGGFVPGNCDCQCQGSAPQPLVFVTSSHSWLASIYSILSVYKELESFCCTNVASPCDPSNLDLKWSVLFNPEVAWLCPGHWFSFCPLAPPLCRFIELSDAIKGQDTFPFSILHRHSPRTEPWGTPLASSWTWSCWSQPPEAGAEAGSQLPFSVCISAVHPWGWFGRQRQEPCYGWGKQHPLIWSPPPSQTLHWKRLRGWWRLACHKSVLAASPQESTPSPRSLKDHWALAPSHPLHNIRALLFWIY